MTARYVLPTCVVLALASPGAAHAQAGDSAHAEALFNTAMQLSAARVYDQACPKFAESKRLAPGVGVSLHLADCYEKLGRKASAWHEFKEAEKLALARHDKRSDVAAAHAAALEPQLNRLTIAAPPTEGAAGAASVLLDDEPVSAGDLGKGLAVDPGDHTVTVNAPGQPPRVFSAHVDAAALATTVALDAPAAEAPPGPQSGPPPPPGPPVAADDIALVHTPRQWIGAELIGAGVIGIGIGAVLIPSSRMVNGTLCDPPLSMRGSWAPSLIAFSAGVVAAGAGLVVYLTAPKSTSVGLVVSPTPLPGGGGATMQASF